MYLVEVVVEELLEQIRYQISKISHQIKQYEKAKKFIGDTLQSETNEEDGKEATRRQVENLVEESYPFYIEIMKLFAHEASVTNHLSERSHEFEAVTSHLFSDYKLLNTQKSHILSICQQLGSQSKEIRGFLKQWEDNKDENMVNMEEILSQHRDPTSDLQKSKSAFLDIEASRQVCMQDPDFHLVRNLWMETKTPINRRELLHICPDDNVRRKLCNKLKKWKNLELISMNRKEFTVLV